MTDLVVTWLLNATPDPQRGTTLAADWSLLGELIDSLEGERLVVISDCLTDPPEGVELFHVDPDPSNVYFLRWRHVASMLTVDESISRLWCVDGTDVVRLRDPFRLIVPGVLCIGSEASKVGSDWMVATNPGCRDWIEHNAPRVLLNPGLVGGDRDTVLEFASRVAEMEGADMSDMGPANVVAYDMAHFTGSAVHTRFKAYERNDVSAWQHK